MQGGRGIGFYGKVRRVGGRLNGHLFYGKLGRLGWDSGMGVSGDSRGPRSSRRGGRGGAGCRPRSGWRRRCGTRGLSRGSGRGG